MSKPKVMAGAERKAALLEVGAKLAAKYGAQNVTRRMVAKAAKVSDALVSNYCGSTAAARSAYARKARALGLEQPTKEKQIELGHKLRAHGPRDERDSRPRSVKEVKAIKEKKTATHGTAVRRLAKPAAAARETKPTAPKAKPTVKPTVAKLPKPTVAPIVAPPQNKSAARAPKAPPVLPPPLPAI